ncbi:serine/threonine protein phosphatase [Streptomyces cinnamoneus]|uniref:Serine/threonine protein phosphatase n=1 Tax=Streptomyces cinnamoneus TaxID=53446 RepID=A0A2G1XNF9_STRCJ|nr:PP2C family protein-serine/threonine phosphatase [Streptomyces cinnamoneus]PHQ52746.1 serine/threonine protein phosphatase [Streptomyces cinnamoneus]PPT11843.1 serine/threonine-protein phosphatase [Streptomyces cinnamoneus]
MRSLRRPLPRRGASGHSRFLFALAQCVPFALALIVVGIEFSPAHFLYTGPLLTATPALAAVTMGPKGTLAAAGLALAISVATATHNQAWGTQQVYTNLTAILLVSLASVMTSSAAHTRRQSELDQVRRIAAAAQRVLLRPVPARLGPVRMASMYLAAETGAQIGGDLYEAVQTRYGVRMIVGDVRGKGLPAVRLAAAVLGAFREAVHYEADLVEVMNHCAAALQRERAVSALSDRGAGSVGADQVEDFVTALVAQVPDLATVQVVNRGHPPPLMLREGEVRALTPASPLPPLGLEEFVTGLRSEPENYPFTSGDRLLLHTDGVIEARNRDNDFFALPQAMASVHDCAPSEFLEQLHQALIRHTEGSLADDVAMVLVDRLDEESGDVPHHTVAQPAGSPGVSSGSGTSRNRTARAAMSSSSPPPL